MHGIWLLRSIMRGLGTNLFWIYMRNALRSFNWMKTYIYRDFIQALLSSQRNSGQSAIPYFPHPIIAMARLLYVFFNPSSLTSFDVSIHSQQIKTYCFLKPFLMSMRLSQQPCFPAFLQVLNLHSGEEFITSIVILYVSFSCLNKILEGEKLGANVYLGSWFYIFSFGLFGTIAGSQSTMVVATVAEGDASMM